MRRRTAILLTAMAVLLIGSGHESHAAGANPKLTKGPEVRSAMALVVDASSGEVIFERNVTSVVPIASITKLMTALVVLDGKQPLDEVVELTAADRWKGKGAHSRIPIGAKITRANLLRLALMASENRAAQTLARAYPGGKSAFVKAMNAKAKLLGMTQSRFADASGLSSQNVSSARDLSKLLNATSMSPLIREYSTLPSVEVRINRKSTLVYRNTNLLIGKPDWDIRVQKTGYTNDAGECLVMQAVLDEREVNIVLLNSFGKLTRTADARRIRRWMEAQKSPQVAGASEASRK
jgi:D-alanyl-D-alanine endopeptidase (penicillin-binding protein 7)